MADLAGWSDSGFNVGIHTSGPIAAFADLGVRSSTGFYYAQPLGLPASSGRPCDRREPTPAYATGPDYDVTAAVGAFWFDYAGGTYGVSQPARASLAVPSLHAQTLSQWEVEPRSARQRVVFVTHLYRQYLYAEAQRCRSSLDATRCKRRS